MAEQKKFIPFVSVETNMKEFTIRALIIGLFFAVILGAANAYLGLKAGMTIAATYPAAVLGMAILRMMKGTILEENFICIRWCTFISTRKYFSTSRNSRF